MSRHFKLYIGSFVPNERPRFLASYASEKAARDAVPTWFGQLPKHLCLEITLASPGEILDVWPHPDLSQ